MEVGRNSGRLRPLHRNLERDLPGGYPGDTVSEVETHNGVGFIRIDGKKDIPGFPVEAENAKKRDWLEEK